jgi:hypothetical protein
MYIKKKAEISVGLIRSKNNKTFFRALSEAKKSSFG